MIEEIKEINREDLPDKIKKISPRVKKLYYIGDKTLLFEKSFAIVGTRNSTEYGIRWATYFSREICRRNIVIVSGLAKGIDRCAHDTCLKNSGKTIGVMGTGFGNLYPSENIGLMKEIVDSGGLIITEYEYDMPYRKSNFPMRNRIISGLCDGTLVIEARKKGGSGITANYAFRQGKKVFAVPGRIGDMHSSGCNNLIKKGAYLVEDISDVENIMIDFFGKADVVEEKKVPSKYEEIYHFLQEGESSLDELVLYNHLKYEETAEKLVNMELEDYIESIGGRYRIKI